MGLYKKQEVSAFMQIPPVYQTILGTGKLGTKVGE